MKNNTIQTEKHAPLLQIALCKQSPMKTIGHLHRCELHCIGLPRRLILLNELNTSLGKLGEKSTVGRWITDKQQELLANIRMGVRSNSSTGTTHNKRIQLVITRTTRRIVKFSKIIRKEPQFARCTNVLPTSIPSHSESIAVVRLARPIMTVLIVEIIIVRLARPTIATHQRSSNVV